MNNDYWNAYTSNVQHQYVDWVPSSTQSSQQAQYIHTPYSQTTPSNQYSTSSSTYSSGSYSGNTGSTGYSTGSGSTGYSTGSGSTGYSTGSGSGGYSVGSTSGGYSAGSTSAGYSAGSTSAGYSAGSTSGGYSAGSTSGGYSVGSTSGGYSAGSNSGGYSSSMPHYSALKAKKRKFSATKSTSQSVQVFFGRDETYPADLNALFKPLYCELCGVHLNSVKSSQIHYESKAHDKHITTWLAHNFTEKGLNPPNIKRYVKEVKMGPTAFHCEICNLPLTSLAHAKQHYSGRRHNVVANKISNPSSSSGYYDDQGKWVRTAAKSQSNSNKTIKSAKSAKTAKTLKAIKSAPTATQKNEAFKSDISKTEVSGIKSDADSTNGTATLQKYTKPKDEATFCMTCNISVTSAPQMEMHRQGAKHLKKLKEFGLPPAGKDSDTALVNKNKTDASSTDISVYRTPSGCYYCKICNINVTDESSMRTHLRGKKHIKIALNAEPEKKTGNK